jgi:CO/xanthine dehydrogenase FAD-binding subunit
VGGSVAHADPAAELPTALAALDASFHTRSRRGSRRLGVEQFFAGIFTTALAPDELLTAIEIPLPAPTTGSVFSEFARRHGDFALGGAAVLATLGPERVCDRGAGEARPPPGGEASRRVNR